jgi:hypothetical protein
MASVSSSRRASTRLALLLLLVAAPSAALAGGEAPASWPPLKALYDGGIASYSPNAPASSWAAAADDPATTAAPASDASSSKGPGKKALLYSLLLPGMGELSMGEKGRATGFFIAEGLIWSSFIYWTVAGNLRQDDYIEQANLNAGVGVTNESDDYWKLVGQYERSAGSGPGSYEEDLRREARDIYPDDPAAQDAYVAQHLPTGDRAWEWTSSALQDTYVSTRENSNTAFNRAQYSYAAAILNRIVSVIDVQLLRHKASKEAQSGIPAPEYRLYADTAADGSGRLVIQRRF